MTFRNFNLLKQLKLSFLYKVVSIILSFFITKYMLQYLGVEKYGIWSVLLIFINWILFFDFGISNGIKNRVSESLSKNNLYEAKEYISTGYVIISIFSIVIFVIFLPVSFFVNWGGIFNTSLIDNSTLQITINIILFFILSNFALSIIIAIFNATQQASYIVIQQAVSQFFSLLLILIINKYTNSNLIYLAISYGFALLLSNILISLYFYRKNPNLLPSLSSFSKEKIQDIFKLGMKFFYLQLTILIILSSDRMIITQLLGPTYVATYDILFKYISILMIIHTIVNTPLWSIYTEAYQKNDYSWIKKTLAKMTLLMFFYIFIAFILYYFSEEIIRFWLGDITLNICLSNYIYMIVMILFLIWYSIFAYFTNGINKTKIQFLSATIGAVINIPLSIYLVKYLEMEINGVLLATIISLSIFGITGPIQAIYELRRMKEKDERKR